MKKWLWTSLILCSFGFLKEIRPSESFVTEYIIDFKNVTRHEVVHVAFPVSTYTALGTLVAVFLITDYLRYRPVIIFEGLSYVITWIILIWGTDLTAIIFVEVFYGISCSTEVAYYTYIYSKVEKDKYKKVTSYTSTAILMGKFFSGILAQFLVSLKLMNYHELNYISLAAVSAAFIISIFLPKSNKSLYFNRKEEKKPAIYSTFTILWNDFKNAFGDRHILKWSIWWAVASAGQFQVLNYIQALWEQISEDSNESAVYNGAVKSIHTLLSAGCSFGIGFISLSSWKHWSEILLCGISVIQGGLLVWMSVTNSLLQAYFSYIIFRMIHPVMITIASYEVAQRLRDDSYGLVFGVNTFLALGIQTILTVIVSDAKGLSLTERKQFFIYGLYFGALGFAFMCFFIYTIFNRNPQNNPAVKESLNEESSTRCDEAVDDDNNEAVDVMLTAPV